MFERSAARQRTAAESIRLAVADWDNSGESWFDGTPRSVERRIAKARALRHQLQGAGIEYAAVRAHVARQSEALQDIHDRMTVEGAVDLPVQPPADGVGVEQKFGQWAKQHGVQEPSHRHVSIFANNYTLPVNDVQTLHAAVDSGKFVGPQKRQAIMIAARDFVRGMDADVDLPREEIAFRARRHASNQVWDQPAGPANQYVGAFADTVVALAARRPRTAAAPAPAMAVQDFPDYMLMMP